MQRKIISLSTPVSPVEEIHQRNSPGLGLPAYNSKLAQKSAHAFRQGSRRQAPKSLVRTRTRSKTNPSIIPASGVAAACPQDVFGAAYNRTPIRHSAEESFYLIIPRPPVHHTAAARCKILAMKPRSRPANQQAMCPERP